MPKFEVIIGRIVREEAAIIGEAQSGSEVISRLHGIAALYKGAAWKRDQEWSEGEAHDLHEARCKVDDFITPDVVLLPSQTTDTNTGNLH